MLSRREASGEHESSPDMPPPATPVKACHPGEADTQPIALLSTEGSTGDPEFFRSVARLGIQAADALEHAHQMGVVHRDVKPSNLMVDAAGHLWITDFGLAMTQSETKLTMTGDLLGTLRYMSPEQVQAKRGVLDHRTDVYSLGVTFYELLTLQPAFPGEDRHKLIRQIVEDDPRPPRQLNKSIPKDLETIILKATAKEPQSRYATAEEFADDLRRFLEDQPIRGKRPDPWVRLRKWTKRHRGVTIAAAAVVLAALVMAGGWKLHRDRQLRKIAVSVRESLADARGAIEAKGYDLAQRKLAQAEGRIAEVRAALPGLAADVRQLQEELERLEEFLRLGDEAHFCVRGDRKLIEFAHQAVSLYEVMERADWTAELERSPLSLQQRTQIRQTAYEMLLLLADWQIRWSDPGRVGRKSKESRAGEALAYLEKGVTGAPLCGQ